MKLGHRAVLIAIVVIASFTAIKVPVAFGDEKNGLDFVDYGIGVITAREGGRSKSVMFSDDSDIPCPQVSSFIYSAGDRVTLVTPNFSLMGRETGTFLNHIAREQSRWEELTYQNRACRYVISVKKYVLKDKVETQLQQADFSKGFELLRKLERMGHPVVEGDDNPIEINGGRAILKLNKVDPAQAGITVNGVLYDNPDHNKEFDGLIYFGPRSFAVYLVDALAYRLEYHKNDAGKSYDIDIIGPNTRLSLSLRKEILADGWITSFGD